MTSEPNCSSTNVRFGVGLSRPHSGSVDYRMSTNWRRRAKRFAGFVLALFGAITLADYLLGIRSDAMAFARTRVAESMALREVVGEVRSVRLHPFWGFSNKTGAALYHTSLRLRVEGTHAAAELNMKFGGERRLVANRR
jgi:hypothetical protein